MLFKKEARKLVILKMRV